MEMRRTLSSPADTQGQTRQHDSHTNFHRKPLCVSFDTEHLLITFHGVSLFTSDHNSMTLHTFLLEDESLSFQRGYVVEPVH